MPSRGLTFCLAVWIAMGMPLASYAQNQPRLPKHVTPETVEAIDRGLQYLVRTQGRDGAWRNNGRFGRYPVAMSALAGLALLMDGNTTTQGRYAPQVDRTTKYLLGSTTASGLITRGDEDARPMYGHGFTMLYLGQLLGMAENPERNREIKRMLDRGVELTARSQSRLGGWIYQPNSGGDEGSVTITQVQALRSCRNAGVSVPKVVIDESMDYLVKSLNSDGGIRYRAGQPGPSRPAITAAAVCCWFNAGDYENPHAVKALEYSKENILVERAPHWYYAHLYFAQALYLSGHDEWDTYYPKLRDRLIAMQQEDGSWPDFSIGPVYATTVALIVLQLPYNQLPIMQR